AILVVDRNNLHLKFVAHLANVLDPADILVVQLADMAQAVAARQNLDERAKLLDRSHPTFVHLADANFLADRLDLLRGRFRAGRIQAGDINRAIVLDVDLGAGGFLYALDVLAARADQSTDLFRIDADLDQPRGVRTDGGARLPQSHEHLLEDFAAS